MDARKRAHCGAFRDFECLSSRLNSAFDNEFQPKSLMAKLAVHFPCKQGIYRERNAFRAVAYPGSRKISRAPRDIAGNSLCGRAGNFLKISRESASRSRDCFAGFRSGICDAEHGALVLPKSWDHLRAKSLSGEGLGLPSVRDQLENVWRQEGSRQMQADQAFRICLTAPR